MHKKYTVQLSIFQTVFRRSHPAIADIEIIVRQLRHKRRQYNLDGV